MECWFPCRCHLKFRTHSLETSAAFILSSLWATYPNDFTTALAIHIPLSGEIRGKKLSRWNKLLVSHLILPKVFWSGGMRRNMNSKSDTFMSVSVHGTTIFTFFVFAGNDQGLYWILSLFSIMLLRYSRPPLNSMFFVPSIWFLLSIIPRNSDSWGWL